MDGSQGVPIGFVISGDFITEHARERTDATGWGEAIKFLTTSVEGLSTDEAMSILAGDLRLIGEAGRGKNTLELVEETSAVRDKLRKHQDYMWRGVVRYGKDYWQPYARVSGLDRADYVSVQRNTNRWLPPTYSVGHFGRAASLNLYQARCCYYMDDPTNDRAVVVNNLPGCGPVCVLFKIVPTPPIWLPGVGHADWEAAALQAFNDLRVVGAGSLYSSREQLFDDEIYDTELVDTVASQFTDQSKWPDSQFTGTPKDDASGNLVDMLVSLASGSGAGDEQLQGTAELIMGVVNSATPIDEASPEDHRYGWALPDGRFFPCKYHQHSIAASRIYCQVLDHSEGSLSDNPERDAELAGWLKLTKSVTGDLMAMIYRQPTEAQVAVFDRWTRAHGECELEVYKESE